MGPLSSLTAPLAAWLLSKGWHVHVAVKSSLNILSLSSLDLPSSARAALETALGGHNAFRAFQDRLKLLETPEASRDTTYDALIFCGLPPNYDDARVPRAPWAAEELANVVKQFQGVPVFLISSLWGAIQKDRVVPEEIEFERRKALTNWERLCQSYETKLMQSLPQIESNWYFVRMPMLSGATTNGEPFGFTGPSNLFRELDPHYRSSVYSESYPSRSKKRETQKLAYNPDSTLWFLPVDMAVYMFWRFLEDEHRPRICNFISTQATLNREWLQHLAQSLGLKDIVPTTHSERDSLNLPTIVRRLLLDDVQVKTRNLFEVAGRYQLAPFTFAKEYFDKVVTVGRNKDWGTGKAALSSPFQFSPRLASYYFEQFLPAQVTDNLLRKATMSGITIGFMVKGASGLGWVLSFPDGKAVVQRYELGNKKPRICFSCSGETMTRIIQSKMPLHRALFLRQVEVEGPLLDTLRVTQIINQFLKEHPIDTAELDVLKDDKILV